MSQLFSASHRFAKIVRASFSNIRKQIANPPHLDGKTVDITTTWATFDLRWDDPRRAAIRPAAGRFEDTETFGNGEMPFAVGPWFGTPENVVHLLAKGSEIADPTWINWLQRQGICGPTASFGSFAELRGNLTARGAMLYGCDAYGPELDDLCVINGQQFDLVSSKGMVRELCGAANTPYEEAFNDMLSRTFTAEDFERIRGKAESVFIKSDNAEHGGMGVRRASTKAEFLSATAKVCELTRKYQLNHRLVIQRGVTGTPCSFALVLIPGTDEVAVAAVTEQLVDPHTSRDLGNALVPVTADAVEPLGNLILALARGVRRHLGNAAFGYLMCDFLRTPDGQVFGIDPGLRVSASTPPAMFQRWISEESGSEPYVRVDSIAEMGRSRVSFEALLPALGELADPKQMIRTHRGVIPFSWQHAAKESWGRPMIMAPTEAEYEEVWNEVAKRMPLRKR